MTGVDLSAARITRWDVDLLRDLLDKAQTANLSGDPASNAYRNARADQVDGKQPKAARR